MTSLGLVKRTSKVSLSFKCTDTLAANNSGLREPIQSLNYGETLLVRNLEKDFENVENWLAITMDKGTFEIPDWRSELDSGPFKMIMT